jgi:hypothetical protein
MLFLDKLFSFVMDIHFHVVNVAINLLNAEQLFCIYTTNILQILNILYVSNEMI